MRSDEALIKYVKYKTDANISLYDSNPNSFISKHKILSLLFFIFLCTQVAWTITEFFLGPLNEANFFKFLLIDATIYFIVYTNGRNFINKKYVEQLLKEIKKDIPNIEKYNIYAVKDFIDEYEKKQSKYLPFYLTKSVKEHFENS